MPGIYQAVQRRRVVSQQDGDSFQRLEFGECSGEETKSQSRRRADSVGGKDRGSVRTVRGRWKGDFEVWLVGSWEWS